MSVLRFLVENRMLVLIIGLVVILLIGWLLRGPETAEPPPQTGNDGPPDDGAGGVA